MKALLVECMFVDTNDASRYNADIIAKAIAEGLLGESIASSVVQGWNRSADGNKWWYCTDPVQYCYYVSQWKLINGSWFLFDNHGYAVTGWTNYKDTWYYLNQNSCRMQTGWLQITGNWYFFNEDGVMQTGWIKDSEKDYYLYSTGEMAVNTTVDNYYCDSTGAATKV